MIWKSQLFWKKFGDEAEVVQCPFNVNFKTNLNLKNLQKLPYHLSAYGIFHSCWCLIGCPYWPPYFSTVNLHCRNEKLLFRKIFFSVVQVTDRVHLDNHKATKKKTNKQTNKQTNKNKNKLEITFTVLLWQPKCRFSICIRKFGGKFATWKKKYTFPKEFFNIMWLILNTSALLK